jgi:lipoprotein-anchoring transpeptidase ErfK/SrfK
VGEIRTAFHRRLASRKSAANDLLVFSKDPMKLIISALVVLISPPALAQFASPWDEPPFWERPSARYEQAAPLVLSGGARPEIVPQAAEVVAFPYSYPANSIVVDTSQRKLYYVLADRHAYDYSISVGRDGFTWTGIETISRSQPWPDWHPPPEMRERDPRLPETMTGGIRNPLGAMALYLGNSLYRIHGTNDEETIGEAASSGCFRMTNASVLHLATLVQIGTPVYVLDKLPPPPIAQQPLFQDRKASLVLKRSWTPVVSRTETASSAAAP